MQTAILIFTGSRVVVDSPDAMSWMTREIDSELDNLASGGIVVFGDAPGGDALCEKAVKKRMVRWIKFALDGKMYYSDNRTPVSWFSIVGLTGMVNEVRERVGNKKFPLIRNQAMVRDAARRMSELQHRNLPYIGRTLGLRVPWATTNGTAHTCDLARKASVFDVRSLTYSAAETP